MSDWKRLERVELDGKSNEELKSLIQQNVNEFKVYLETYEGDLKTLEDQLVQENYEYDENLKNAEYELPEGVEFEGGHYSRSEIGNSIIYLLNKMEVKFSETLGMHEMIHFWKSNPTTIKHAVLDSILRILQTLSFNGDKEWNRVLAINAYIENKLQQEYIANIIYVHYGAYLHDELVKFIEGEQNNTPETPDTEIPDSPVVEECEVVVLASLGGTVKNDYLKVEKGQEITLEATVSEGYEFYGWVVDNILVSKDPSYTTKVYTDTIYKAMFDKKYIETPDTEIPDSPAEECEVIAIAGEGGSVEKEYQKIVFGTRATLKATPNEGYEFYGWYVDGVCVSTSQEYTTTIYSDMRYIADFDIIIPDTEIPEETPTE